MSFAYRPTIKRKVTVDTHLKLYHLQQKMMKVEEFAFDTETNGFRCYGPDRKFKCVDISISWGDYDNYFIPLGHVRDEDLDHQLDTDLVSKMLKPCFERTDVRIIGQNLKFDMHVMARIGIFIKTKDLFDTMIASWLCNENEPNGLKENSHEKLGVEQGHFGEVLKTIPNEIKKQWGFKSNAKGTIDLCLIKDVAPYAFDDSFYTWHLYLGFIDELVKENMYKIYWKMYAPFTMTLFMMEEHGVTVDTKRLRKMQVEIAKDMEDLEYRMYELAGVEFSATSDLQKAEILFGYVKKDKPNKKTGKMTVAKPNRHIIAQAFNFAVISLTDGGQPQTNNDVLRKIALMEFKSNRKRQGVELCKLLLKYSKLSKLRTSFIDGMFAKLYDDGKAHPNYKIIGTDSGRISCAEPNLQQLPKAEEDDKYQIRSVFIGSEYLCDKDGNYVNEYNKNVLYDKKKYEIKRKKIIALDFSNLEMRVLAHFSEDKNLLRMFANGEDTHGSTAVNMFGLKCTDKEVKKLFPHLRQASKIINFLLMYGGGAYTLYVSLRDDEFSPIDLGSKEYLDLYKVRRGEDVAQIYIDKYFSTYTGVAQFIRDQKRYAHKNGFTYTLLHRKRRLPEINSHDFKTMLYNERLSVNSPTQGSAADITASAQNRIITELLELEEQGCFMLMQVHDELVFECPEDLCEEVIPKIKWMMEHPFGDKVKLNLDLVADYDTGNNYQEAK